MHVLNVEKGTLQPKKNCGLFVPTELRAEQEESFDFSELAAERFSSIGGGPNAELRFSSFSIAPNAYDAAFDDAGNLGHEFGDHNLYSGFDQGPDDGNAEQPHGNVSDEGRVGEYRYGVFPKYMVFAPNCPPTPLTPTPPALPVTFDFTGKHSFAVTCL